MKREPHYGFRAVEARDLPMLRRWLEEPHVRRWWGDPDEALAEIGQAINSDETEPLIVELDGMPIAYLQSYDPHLEDDHPYGDQPTGTLGLDLTIGIADLVGKGHGPAILRGFAAILFNEGAPRLIVDPDPANASALRAYEKAGFRHFDTRDTIYGPAHLMALEAQEDDTDA